MQNTRLDEVQAGIKIAGRNINNLRYADDTTLMTEREKELKGLSLKVKESEKAGLKRNIQKQKSTVVWFISTEMRLFPTLPAKSYSHNTIIHPIYASDQKNILKAVISQYGCVGGGWLFSSSLLSAIRVVPSAYLRLLIFLPAILIPACTSSSPAFLMMYSV